MKKSLFIISILLLVSSYLTAQDLYDINTITQIEITFAESNWDYILDTYYATGDEERLVGSVQINGIQFDSVGVRYKGNSSYSPNNDKNPFNIKLDHIIDDQTYQNYGTLKLANGYKDPSFVRETLSYEIARNYMPAGLANYCEVSVNGQYIGLYTSVQSVDKYFKNSHFPGAVDVRFKGELASGASPTVTTIWGYRGTDSSNYYNYYELKSDEGWADLIEFLEVFNNNPEEMADYLNVDNHLWMLAFDILTVNLDAPINFGHNFYLFKDGSDRFNPIIWDLNENFGGFSMLLGGQPLSTSQMQTLDPLLNINDSDYPIIGKVLNIDTYQKMYIAHMRTIIEEIFQSGWYETRAYELQDIIDSEYQNDPNTFYSYNQFLQNINSTAGGGPGSQPVVGITELMNVRATWLLSQSEFQGTIPEISNQNYTPQFVAPGTTVWVNVDVADADDVFLNYRLNTYDGFSALEMYDDGNHNDGAAGDGTFGVSIQVGYDDVHYYFYAQNSDQGAFLPQKASNEYYEIGVMGVTGDVVINEINYNSADDFDPEDWIELYNNDDQEVDISGWIVKDDSDDHIFVIPDNTILAQGEYLVLCVDTALFTSCFPDVDTYIGNLDFGLGGGGDQVRLFNSAETLIDSVEYDDSDPWPTEPDGNGPTLELEDPYLDNTLAENWHASLDHGTPGAINSSIVPMDDIVINEINYNSADDFDAGDWIELYNNDVEGVDISGWSFKDDDDEHSYTLPDNTILGQGEYLVLCADTSLFMSCFPEVSNFVGNFDFGLGGGGDQVRLFDVTETIVDSVEYDDEDPWPTEPDGSGPTLELLDPDFDNTLAENWHASTDHGTPGAINSCIVPADDIVINEINYNSADDFDPEDWVELYNNDVEDIDISGWMFKDEDDEHVFTIPDNTILGQGEYLVLCSESDLFTNCFPDVDNYVGDLGYGLSGGGELIRLYNSEGILVDFVEYDDEDPWPTEPDGNGPTLELDDPNLDNTLAENWHASNDHGTPGALNSSVSIDNPELYNSLQLHNYPNPFYPTTSISFSLPSQSHVELIVYNIKGQVVKSLINDSFLQGEHFVTWGGKDENGNELKSGVYLYRMMINGETKETQRMILMK